MHINWKKTIIVALDVVLGIYVAVAMTSFNKTEENSSVCSKVAIDISDGTTNGFLSSDEIKKILQRHDLYPLSRKMSSVNPRQIEDLLKVSPFVKTAECFKTTDGHVNIVVTQRMPIVRIKSDSNADYYLDEKGGIMPNSKYTSDLIIASGHITKSFATNYIAFLADALMDNDLWRNLIEQINVLPDQSVELVPRVGDHVVNIGYLPAYRNRQERQDSIASYVNKQMTRLEKFYKYGLSQAGWNKYSYIDLEFTNQIICKKRSEHHVQAVVPETPVMENEVPEPLSQASNTSNSIRQNSNDDSHRTTKKEENRKSPDSPKSVENKNSTDGKKKETKKTPDKKSNSNKKSVDNKKDEKQHKI